MIPMDAARQVMRDKPTRLAASRMFGGLRPETERPVRTHKVESNPALECMKRAWAMCDDIHLPNYGEIYSAMRRKIRKHQYSAKDVEDFSMVLAEFQGEENFSNKAGLFLSALINNCKEDGFLIHTVQLAKPIHSFGFRNTKNIAIDGDIGDVVGEEMVKGAITVKGNAGGSTGFG